MSADVGALTDEQQARSRQAIAELMPATPFIGWLGDDKGVAHAVQTYRIV